MTFLSILRLAQEAPTQALPDSTVAQVATETAVSPDTLSSVGSLSQEVGEAGRNLVSGDFDAFAELSRTFAERIIDALPQIAGAIVVFILLYVTYRFIGFLLKRTLSRARKVDIALEHLIGKTYRILGMSLIFIMVLAQFGVNITALIAGLSVVGIAVGFAAQDTISNFISGVTILLDVPFKIGHFIEIEGVKGTVTHFTLRSTRIRTLNNKQMVLPNSHMINQKLINHTALGLLRIEIRFSIAYKEKPAAARDVILKATKNDPRLHPDFQPTVVVEALADSSINMILRMHLRNPDDEIGVKYEYTETVREVLREANIEIPFPHLQLHIDSAKGLKKF